jgi:tetratricopeptide (TPR) repeat protein
MARPRIRPADGRNADPQSQLDEQQLLVLAILREARGAPVDYATLKAAGLEWPASVICELELLGWPVERARGSGSGGPCVRLDPTRDPLAHPPPPQAPPPRPSPAHEPLPRPSPAHTPGEFDSDYRLYHTRPWSGAAALLADAARLRRARLASALLVGTCVVVALALAGVFSGGAHASREAARLGTRVAQRDRRRARDTAGRRPRDSRAGRTAADGKGSPGARGFRRADSQSSAADAASTSTPGSTRTATTPATSTDTTPATSTQATGGAPATSPSATSLEAQGHALLTAGQYGQAIPLLRRALAATGESTGTCLQPATEACLTYAYALYDLATALRLSGDPAAAVPLLEQRLSLDNQRPVVAAELTLARSEAQRSRSRTAPRQAVAGAHPPSR